MTLYHWADQVAEKIVRQKGEKEEYTVVAGITPSGTIHVGNLREIITVEIVARALRHRGKKVRFLYDWDDFDVFRKVPVNMPNQDLLQTYLRKAILDIPDTFDCHHESYARHNECPVEDVVPKLGIIPQFKYNGKLYRACTYAQGVKKGLEHTERIKEILNEHRKEPLADDWLPVEIFCEQCGKDTITKKEYKGEYIMYYECKCGTAQTFDFREKGIIKLKWRIDWPMRWDYENVDCEPAGKDHSAAGGSRTTGELIQKDVYGSEPPVYFGFEWIHIKGGQEFSSSKGIATTTQDVLKVYQPEILRWLFAGSRPSAAFAIAFDLDVIKLYEDFDKCERIYFGAHKVSDKEFEKQKRIYELSMVNETPKTLPFQASFRHLTNVLLVNQGDLKKTVEYYQDQLKDEFDKEQLTARANCAWNWLQNFAPEEFKYSVKEKVNITLPDQQKQVFKDVAALLDKDWNDKDLHNTFYATCKKHQVDPKEFFQSAYKVLIGKDKGPQLANFILTIGKGKVRKLFQQI